MSLGLTAPAAFPVEVRAGANRVFRLCAEVGEAGVRLERPAPFEIDRVVDLRFRLPGGAELIAVRARIGIAGAAVEREGEAGGLLLLFVDPPTIARASVAGYVWPRLGLPAPA